MKYIVLLLIALRAASAADYEQFTLRDGRTLIGQYDEARGVLVMESPHAEVRIDARDITKREAVDPPAPKPKPEAAPAPAAHVTDDELRALDVKVSDLNAQAAALKAQADQLRLDYCRHWLLAANLDPAAQPTMDADPTRSQMARNEEVRNLNARLVQLRQIHSWLLKDGAQHDGNLLEVDTFVHGPMYPLYLETRAAGKHAPAQPDPSEAHEAKPKGKR